MNILNIDNNNQNQTDSFDNFFKQVQENEQNQENQQNPMQQLPSYQNPTAFNNTYIKPYEFEQTSQLPQQNQDYTTQFLFSNLDSRVQTSDIYNFSQNKESSSNNFNSADNFSDFDDFFNKVLNNEQKEQSVQQSQLFSDFIDYDIFSNKYIKPAVDFVLQEPLEMVHQPLSQIQIKSCIVQEPVPVLKKKEAKKNNIYTSLQRQQVQQAYFENLTRLLSIGCNPKKAHKIARKNLKKDQRFSKISRQTINYWIKTKKQDNTDKRKELKGNLMYEEINGQILKDLPKAIFNYKGKSFFKTTIYNKIIVDLYEKNKEAYKQLLSEDKVFDKNGKRKAFTKGWFIGFSTKFNLNFQNIKKRKVNGETIVTSMEINGKVLNRQDYM